MDKKTVIHATLLTLAVFLILSWLTEPALANYSLQLSGILMLVLIISRHLLKPASFKLAESTISTMAILLINGATGGITSPFFFLNHFLLFELSLLLEPVIPFILSFALISFYIYSNPPIANPLVWLQLLSFLFITPIAFYFGKIYQKEINQKKMIKSLTKRIEELEEELVDEELANIHD